VPPTLVDGIGSSTLCESARFFAAGIPALALDQSDGWTFEAILYLLLLPLSHDAGKWYKLAGFRMTRGRTHNGRIIVFVLVVLMLCVIVTVELPELLSLADNTSNDFTVRKINTADPFLLNVSIRHRRSADVEFCSSAPEFPFSNLNSFEKTQSVSSRLFVLYSDLRT
jgi:hypothetical protein